MAEEDSLLALQGLHSDLIAFSENRLQEVDRLISELDSRIDEFRELLDKKAKNDASRRELQKGTSLTLTSSTSMSIASHFHASSTFNCARMSGGGRLIPTQSRNYVQLANHYE